MQKQKKFQIDVEDPYSLNSELQFPGLVVLEIFAHWCDVCKSIDPIFRSHFVDLATRKLKFVRVQHAFVPWLRRYHGHCRPTFLFFVGGSLKEIVEGIDTPRLDTLIPQLAPEDDVPLEKFVPEDSFPELNSDEAYQQYAARMEELERNRAIAIEAGTDADIDPRGEYNSLVKEFEKTFQLPMSAYSSKLYTSSDAPKASTEQAAKPVNLEKDESSMQQPPEEQTLAALPDATEAAAEGTQAALVELDDRPCEQPRDTEEVMDTAAADAPAADEQNRPLSDASEERLPTPASQASTEEGRDESIEKGAERSMLDDLDLGTRRSSEHPDQESAEDGQENSEGAFHYETNANAEIGQDEHEVHDGHDEHEEQDGQQEPGSHHSDDHLGSGEEKMEASQPHDELNQSDTASADAEHEEDKTEAAGSKQDASQESDNPPEDKTAEEQQEPEEPVRNVESAGTNGTTDVLDFAYTPENVDGEIVDLLEAEEAANQADHIDSADQEQ